jgi:hypothetical protein
MPAWGVWRGCTLHVPQLYLVAKTNMLCNARSCGRTLHEVVAPRSCDEPRMHLLGSAQGFDLASYSAGLAAFQNP